MLISIDTSYKELMSELQQRLNKQFGGDYYGIYLEDIRITDNVRNTVIDKISSQLLETDKLEIIVPSTLVFNIIMKNTKVYEYQFDYVRLDMSINLITEYSNTRYIDLIKAIKKRLYVYNMDLKTSIGNVSDFNFVPTNDYTKVKFITMSIVYFEMIKDSIGTQYYVKKPTYKNVNSVIEYYLDRDSYIIERYKNLLYGLESVMNKHEFYLHLKYPVYKQRLMNGDYLYISATFIFIQETETKEILVIYDYKDKRHFYNVKDVLEKLHVNVTHLQPILNLYKYHI